MDLNNTDTSNRLVRYTGCSDTQARLGAGNDPRELLEVDAVYRVIDLDIGAYSSTITIEGFDKRFNTVLFDELYGFDEDVDRIDADDEIAEIDWNKVPSKEEIEKILDLKTLEKGE